jgi:hypothetical protein
MLFTASLSHKQQNISRQFFICRSQNKLKHKYLEHAQEQTWQEINKHVVIVVGWIVVVEDPSVAVPMVDRPNSQRERDLGVWEREGVGGLPSWEQADETCMTPSLEAEAGGALPIAKASDRQDARRLGQESSVLKSHENSIRTPHTHTPRNQDKSQGVARWLRLFIVVVVDELRAARSV